MTKKTHVEHNLDFDYEKTDGRYPPGFNERIIARVRAALDQRKK
jgi:hypothetical protein